MSEFFPYFHQSTYQWKVEGRVLLNVANTCEHFGDFQQQETPDLQYEKSSCFFSTGLEGPEFGHNKTVKR